MTQHPKHYNASESARLTALTARGALQAGRGKSTAKVDAALDRLAAEAVEREAREAAAAKAARDKAAQDRADAKAKRRAESLWW